jgi:hypothetical protein
LPFIGCSLILSPAAASWLALEFACFQARSTHDNRSSASMRRIDLRIS